nr:AraC family transcriptional regulator [Cohnella zeiphila]
MRIVRGGIGEGKPNYRSGPKRIECYSIHFVRDGHLTLEYRDKRTQVRGGDLFCLYPNVSYTYYRQSNEEPLRLCWLAIDGAGAEQLLKLAGFDADNPVVRQGWNRQTEELLESVYAILRREPPQTMSDHLELKSRLYQLFALLLRARGEPAAVRPTSRMQACANYIELHALDGITVQQVARMAGLNRTYFSTVFSRTFGISPAEYIYKVRMNRAKDLLLATSASITEIAYSLGYPSLFAFTRAFKKYFSLSPSEYRGRSRGPAE